MEKKIATSVEVLIQPVRFESIRITKYSEAKIEYSSEEERIKQEDALQALAGGLGVFQQERLPPVS